MVCDVCGLPDPYRGDGDGIGSCDCPRCEGCGAAHGSYLCTCPPGDDPPWPDDYGWDDPADNGRQVVTVELPGISR